MAEACFSNLDCHMSWSPPQGSDVEVEVPANISKYMEAVLAFTTHSSQVRWQLFFLGWTFTSKSLSCLWSLVIFFFLLQFLKSSTLATWGSLFRHETLSKEAVVVEMAIKYLRASMTNLVKVSQWFQCYHSSSTWQPNRMLPKGFISFSPDWIPI